MEFSTGEADRDGLKELADRAGRSLEDAPPQAILRWGFERFGSKMCVAASMADSVLIHMASVVRPGADVLFLDTGYHFEETLATRDLIAARFPVRVLSITPKQTVAEQDEFFGPQLYERDPDACCSLRKVEPLRRALKPYSAWAAGIRRDETEARRAIRVVEWDAHRSIVKVNPLAAWTQAQVDQYIVDNDLVVNPLIEEGYLSIGCAPCTHRVSPGEDPRSGRWAGRAKYECGLHMDRDGQLRRSNDEESNPS